MILVYVNARHVRVRECGRTNRTLLAADAAVVVVVVVFVALRGRCRGRRNSDNLETQAGLVLMTRHAARRGELEAALVARGRR